MGAGCQGGWLHQWLLLLLLLAALVPESRADHPPESDYLSAGDYSNNYDLSPARLSCDAQYSAPCARANAEWLATKTSKDLTAELEAGTITLDVAWDIIRDGQYNLEINFYPFVLERNTGVIMAHGATSALDGLDFYQIIQAVNLNFFDVGVVLENFRNSANKGGGWVRYYWGSGDYTYTKKSFAVNLTDDYILAVGYENQPLPREVPCSADFDAWCSFSNVRSLVGQAQFLLSDAETLSQFEQGAYELSFNEEAFQIRGGFYLFMYAYEGPLVSHAKLHSHFGLTSGEIFEELSLGTREDGERLHERMIRAAEGQNDGWIQYAWINAPGEEPFTKVAYVVKIEFQGKNYILGSGFTFRTFIHDQNAKFSPTTGQMTHTENERGVEVGGDGGVAAEEDESLVDLPSVGFNGTMSHGYGDPCRTCTAKYNLPCGFGTSLQLASHATTHAISSPLPADEIWRGISMHPTFKLNDFYIYVYDFNATLVAHGVNRDYVGMTMQEIYDSANIAEDATETHRLFRDVAVRGGGWVIYDWLVPGSTDIFQAKIAYIWRINIGARSYYAGIGFFHNRAPLLEYAEKGTLKNGDPILCSSEFSLECSKSNAEALVGHAAAHLTLASSSARIRLSGSEEYYSHVEDVLTAITKKYQAFFFNDFYISAFWVDGSKCESDDVDSGCCAAHGANPEYVGKTWKGILDMEEITSIPGHVLHRQLLWQSSQISEGHLNYTYSHSTGEVKTKVTVSSMVETEEGDLYVVAEYFATEQTRTCDSCPDGYQCTRPTQAFCEEIEVSYTNHIPAYLVAAVPLVVLLSSLFIYWYGHQNWRKRQVLAQKIKQMESQMKDMVEIVHDTGVQIMTADDYRDKFGDVGVGVEKAPPPKIEIAWYWEESERFLSRHHSTKIMSGEHFVKYTDASSAQIERAYQRWKEGNGFKEVRLDLTGKINKFDSQASGCQYVIDFEEMTQRNVWSSYSRNIRRHQHTVAAMDLEVVSRLPPLPNDIDFFSKDGEDFLPTYPGQVIQVSKEHPSKQWIYGSVLYDPLLADAQNRPQGVGSNDGLNRILAMALHDRPTSGWFPAALSKPADVKVMQNLVESLGGEGVTNLKPPGRWKPQKEGCVSVEQGSAEYQEVAHYFLAALYEQRDNVSVVGIERIQCMPLWQSYAVKKETMRTRDAKNPGGVMNNRSGSVERRWLFHGTTHEVIPKIVKQGFNRAFAGRNAVAFGKGVYFARDAAYSSHQAYSTPDTNGIQRMFLCRVAVGDWCRGDNGQLTPDAKPRNRLELFDSTVDDVSDPTIFVVYHDAQAYPDYLVSFRRQDEETD